MSAPRKGALFLDYADSTCTWEVWREGDEVRCRHTSAMGVDSCGVRSDLPGPGAVMFEKIGRLWGPSARPSVWNREAFIAEVDRLAGLKR